MMIATFALDRRARRHGKTHREGSAIFEACMLRFRPIMMTTMAALFGALPLAFGTGTGSELRRPLGISIVGGLLMSQLLDALHDAGRLSLTSIGYACGFAIRRRSHDDAARCMLRRHWPAVHGRASTTTVPSAPVPASAPRYKEARSLPGRWKISATPSDAMLRGAVVEGVRRAGARRVRGAAERR